MQKYRSALEKCSLFDGIQTQDLQAMLGCIGGHILFTPKGQPVLREGDPATHIGMVLSGAVRMEREDYYGNRSIVALVSEGSLFAEAYACAGAAALPISVVADEDSTVLLMDSRRITVSCSNACAFHSRIIHNLLRLVANSNLLLDQKIQVTSRRTTREKLMEYLLNQAKLHGSNSFTIPYDRQELADYLGVERSAMSAELSKLQKEGTLITNRSHFQLL